MNKQDIINKLSKETELSSAKSGQFIEKFIEIVGSNLTSGEKTQIRSFGTFDTGNRKAHTGTHPMTGKKLEIPETSTARFHPSQILKALVK